MKQKTRRRSYKNAIAIGIASFTSIALISTGLASFVIIRNADQTAGGNIIVAAVSDTQILLNITPGTEEGDITLDAEAGDYDGRVQLEQGGVGAKLSHTVTGTVEVGSTKTIADNVELSYTVNIKIGTSVANDEFTEKYITTEMLSLNGFVLGSLDNAIPTFPGAELYQATFTMNFGFTWGALFGGVNPSVYYDTDPAGTLVTDAEVITKLEALKSVEVYTFEIVIFAKNK